MRPGGLRTARLLPPSEVVVITDWSPSPGVYLENCCVLMENPIFTGKQRSSFSLHLHAIPISFPLRSSCHVPAPPRASNAAFDLQRPWFDQSRNEASRGYSSSRALYQCQALGCRGKVPIIIHKKHIMLTHTQVGEGNCGWRFECKRGTISTRCNVVPAWTDTEGFKPQWLELGGETTMSYNQIEGIGRSIATSSLGILELIDAPAYL